jgi:very-short-patch-repair endonuclease
MHTNFAVAMMAGTVHQNLLVSGYSVQGQRARHLRIGMTDAELKLWQQIRGRQLRQLTVMDEQVVNSLGSHPPLPPF